MMQFQLFPKDKSLLGYPYKCTNCGKPHKHLNRNVYPELCKKCALKQSKIDRQIDKAMRELTDHLAKSLFTGNKSILYSILCNCKPRDLLETILTRNYTVPNYCTVALNYLPKSTFQGDFLWI